MADPLALLAPCLCHFLPGRRKPHSEERWWAWAWVCCQAGALYWDLAGGIEGDIQGDLRGH